MAKRRVKYSVEAAPVEPSSEGETSGVYARGQTVIPKEIRETLAIEYGTRLRWEVHEGVIHVMPIPKNPVQALRGALKGTGVTFESFIEQRRQERERERALEEGERWRTSSTRQQ